MITKICTKCKCEKSLEYFPKDKRAKDGRASDCKICRVAAGKERRERQKSTDPLFYEKERKRVRDSYILKEITLGPEGFTKLKADRYAKYRVSQLEQVRKKRRENKDEVLLKDKIQRDRYKDKKKIIDKAWWAKNPVKSKTYVRNRQARKLQAMPKWAKEEDILSMYELVKIKEKVLGTKCHLDHIVPLQSKLVCGFHCKDNLQILPAKENSIKGNRFWPDMFEPKEALEFYKLK